METLMETSSEVDREEAKRLWTEALRDLDDAMVEFEQMVEEELRHLLKATRNVDTF